MANANFWWKIVAKKVLTIWATFVKSKFFTVSPYDAWFVAGILRVQKWFVACVFGLSG
jgi:hypothetical protein